MDSSKKYTNTSPEETTNIFSKLFFCWLFPFFNYGYRNDIQLKDVYSTADIDTSAPLGNSLEKHWNEQLDKSKNSGNKPTQPSLKRAIFNTFIKSYSYYGILLFFQCVIIKMFQPIVLAAYIKYYDTSYKNRKPQDGWGLASGVVLMAFANVLIMHWIGLGTQRVGMRVRTACCSLIYRKLLRLNSTSLGQTAAGQLVNIMSNDVMRFDLAAVYLHYIWIMPIQICIAFYIMYDSIGVAAVPPLAAMTLQAVTLQGYLSKLQGSFRGKIAQLTDNRVKLMSEITAGIQVIKMYAWEKPFEKIVEVARKSEIDVVQKTSYIKGFMSSIGVFTERAILYIAVITYVLLGNPISGDVVFSVAQLLNTVQLYMCIFFPWGLTTYAEASVSIRRIEGFLLLEENESIHISSNEKQPKTGMVSIKKANASWLPNTIVDTLLDVNLEIPPGCLCCVVGNVGSGKSSLLQLLLGELLLNTGTVSMGGKIAYAAQEPWLFVSTVRQNILFGLPYDKERYAAVIRACALERDFQQFPQGDKTMVGERGVSLSGGQRARINLARAVYRSADIYLFDDPLSAVDTHVAKHLFEKCFQNYLSAKTRVLVTHQVQFLKHADLIVVLNNGKIDKVGRFKDLSDTDLEELSKESESNLEENANESPEHNNVKKERLQSISSVTSSVTESHQEDESPETQELIEKGAIPTSTYWEYYKAGAQVIFLIVQAFLMVFAQGICNASDLWVTYWTNQATRDRVRTNSNSTESPLLDPEDSFISNDSLIFNISQINNDFDETVSQSTELYIYVYTTLIIGAILFTIVRSLTFMKICMTASKKLHNKMFSNILKAPMRFFDTNPSGRILNRFSKDMGAVDEILPKVTMDCLQIFLVMAGILVMVFIVQPFMIIPAIFLGVLFLFVRNVYLASAQNVKRLEGTTKAPVFSHVSATLSGLHTIRSCEGQAMVAQEFDSLQDQHSSTWFMFIATSEAFGLYLDLICTIFLALVAYQFLIFQDENTMSGNVGLVIAHSLILTGMVQYGVRLSAEVSSNMTSVERVLQYTKLEQEGPFESVPTKKPPRDWPSFGGITFEKTYLRYVPEDPPVLRNLNIQIQPGEKVGIVGRTGAGKSTLIASLFRLAPIEGKILIDSIDTGDIGLHDLRSNISIIPQEPVLFSATVRYNLDPFNKYSDEAIWKALDDVELKRSIESLNQRVSEGGSNFSAGQRQLICLARAIVRNNKVLVMDEATANVDPNTDSLIQKTIRRNFKDCTVLTIAHRLNTIMDSDKVLVMDAGQAVEFGHPHELLQNSDGYFSKMLIETGKNMEQNLRRIAKQHYENKFGTGDEQINKD